jgi:DNA polymerase-1
MTTAPPETLYLIDSHAQIFRAYYAIRGGLRSSVTGEPTHAVFGVTGMIIKLLSQFHPQYIVAANDAPGKTFRDDLYAEYKGTRENVPDDLVSQIPRVHELLELFGIPIIGVSGLEADDIIATITQRVLDDPSCNDVQIRIVSKDKDLEQLLGDRVTMFDIHTDTTIDVEALWENKGIKPEQVIDVLALMGDTADNVPGVEGIGAKTAAKLINQFGSIDAIFANIDQIKGKRRENLEKARSHLPLSRTLVTLKHDAELDFSLERARVKPLNPDKLLPLFQQLDFHRFQGEVKRLAAGDAISPRPEQHSATTTRRERRAALEQETSEILEKGDYDTAATGAYEAITTKAQLNALVETVSEQPMVSVDTETTSLNRDAELCGLSFSWKPGHGVYVPILSPNPGAHLDAETILTALKPVLENPDLPKCGHNLKFDAGILLRNGVKLRGVVFDTMFASLLIDPKQPAHNLDTLALLHLKYKMIPISDLIGEGEAQSSIDKAPLDKVVTYASEDTDIVLRLYEIFKPKLAEMGITELVQDIESPLGPILAEMEFNGIVCDKAELGQQSEVIGERIDQLRDEVHEVAGRPFHLESPHQIASVLFDDIGFEPVRKTKGGRPSTDVTVLEALTGKEDVNDPRTTIPGLLIEYRQLRKLQSTYLGQLQSSVREETGRIHTHFYQLTTATGRLKSDGPNLQNIPVRTEVGRQLRKAFTAPDGKKLICADYSQIELRLLAHFSVDPAMLDIFHQNLDIHTSVASQVFDVSMDAVTREQRDKAKTINFGIIYGVSPIGLSRRIKGMSVADAATLIDGYKERFPDIERFFQKCIQQALEQGYVSTLTGRRRAIPEIHSPSRVRQSQGERLAINTVIQGSAADLIKVAMVNVQHRIDRDSLPLKLLLQIHDELVFETPEETTKEQAAIVCEEMEQAMTLRVPLETEAGIGDNWMAAK